MGPAAAITPPQNVEQDHESKDPSTRKRSTSPAEGLKGINIIPTTSKRARLRDYENEAARAAKTVKRKEETLRFLQGKLGLRVGYEEFSQSKGKSFHPPDILRICKFASDFITQFDDSHTSSISVSTYQFLPH